VVIRTKQKDESFFTIKKLIISHPEAKLLLDDVVEVATPVEIGIMKDKVNIIVGKDRLFE